MKPTLKPTHPSTHPPTPAPTHPPIPSERFATEMNHSVLVLEKREHIGGNCYDYIDDETGLRVNLYVAHLFHTNHRRVWEYVQLFSVMKPKRLKSMRA
jgi:UDP-galactopyranose mutase